VGCNLEDVPRLYGNLTERTYIGQPTFVFVGCFFDDIFKKDLHMLLSIVKFFTIIFGSLFLYKRILNFKDTSMGKTLLSIVFSIGAAYLMYVMPAIPSLRVAFMVLLVSLYTALLTKINLDLAITTTIISVGISYAANAISVLFSAFIQHLVFSSTNLNLLTIVTLAIDILILQLPFLFKRTRKGFLFLRKKEAGGTGLLISGIIILLILLMGIRDTDDFLFGALFIASIICIAGMVFWWRNGITKLYRERLNEKNRRALEAENREKDVQIQKLTERNDFLAELIHRDNKLLPALYSAVLRYTHEAPQEGELLLAQLAQLMQERSGILLQDRRAHKALPRTKVDLIDHILHYMYEKATQKDIEFDLRITGSIVYLTEHILTPLQLETLLADHIENAIIAVDSCAHKRILVTLGVAKNCYELSIRDSGTPFDLQTLLALGTHKTTTHGREGGSGIGFMTSFKLREEMGASLIITEHPPKPYSFVKTVTIRFDVKNEYILRSFRHEELRAHCERADVILLPESEELQRTDSY